MAELFEKVAVVTGASGIALAAARKLAQEGASVVICSDRADGKAIEDLNNDYYEDPTWGLNGMRRVREKVDVPLSTNTVVIDFEQLASNVLNPAVDVVLLDTTFWGGIRPCIKAAGVCETFQLGVAVHSSGELGIQLATMLHLGAVVPNLTFSADAHYHHLKDDVIEGGRLEYRNGSIKVPDTPGLGVRLDWEKLERYAGSTRSWAGTLTTETPVTPTCTPLSPNSVSPTRTPAPQVPCRWARTVPEEPCISGA